jgi:hypothetical protein
MHDTAGSLAHQLGLKTINTHISNGRRRFISMDYRGLSVQIKRRQAPNNLKPCGSSVRPNKQIHRRDLYSVMNCVACRPVNSCLCGKHGWSGSTVDMMDYKFARLVIVRSHSILANQIAVGTICIKALSPMGSLVEWRTKLWTAECRPTYIEHRLFQRRLARGERMPR